MTPTYHRTRDGQQVDERDASDERGCLRDGFTMRTKLMMRDGVPVEGLTDEQRNDQIDAYNARVSAAWRKPSPVVDCEAEAKVRDAKHASVTNPYERYESRIQDAWRS